MSNQVEKAVSFNDQPATTRCIWVTLEPAEVIELKRIAMDSDLDGAVSFFNEILLPRVQKAASQRGIAPELSLRESKYEHLPG